MQACLAHPIRRLPEQPALPGICPLDLATPVLPAAIASGDSIENRTAATRLPSGAKHFSASVCLEVFGNPRLRPVRFKSR